MFKIKKGDEVVITTGKNKGQRGLVLKLIDNCQRVLVEGQNLVKRHTKPNPQNEQPGGIFEKEAPLHISNVAIVNPTTGKADRVGFAKGDDNKFHRIFKSNKERVDI